MNQVTLFRFNGGGAVARMTRAGVDYFPLDCVLDDKFQLIEAEYGLKGFGSSCQAVPAHIWRRRLLLWI